MKNSKERFTWKDLPKRTIYLSDTDLKKFNLYGKIEVDNIIIEKI